MGQRFAILGSRGYPSTYGGFETMVRRLAPYLVEHGDEVVVYCREGSPREETIDGVQCVTTRGLSSNSLSTLSHGLTAARDARSRSLDAALVLNVANGYFLSGMKRAGIPTAVNVDGIEWERGKWSRLGKAMFRRGADLTAKHADTIIADSLEIGRIWQETFNRKSTFIPYGADVVDDLGSARVETLGVTPNSYVLVVARLVPENSIDLLLDALDRLPAKLPVVIVGSANSDSPITARLSELQRYRSNFWWLGHVSDQELLAELWANAALYFHGHTVGGTNPALLQALGYGAPTLALNTAFSTEVIASDEQLVPPNAADLATAIEALVDDESRREKFRQHGRAVVAERYTWASVLADYRSALVRLCK